MWHQQKQSMTDGHTDKWKTKWPLCGPLLHLCHKKCDFWMDRRWTKESIEVTLLGAGDRKMAASDFFATRVIVYHEIVKLNAKSVLEKNEADFIQSLLSTGKKHLASRFNLTYRYIDDVLSINNPEFENYLGQMYPAELEIKDTTESTTSASYLDLLLSIGRDGQLHTSIYDKRDDFNFHITNFPFLSSNIPSSPAYGVFISQLIRYARACSSYECFILRARRLSSKLLKQGYLVERLKSSFRKFYGRYGDLIEQYGVTLSRMLNDILTLDQQWLPYPSDFPPISWPLYRAWPSPNYEWFPWSICNGCG